MIHVKKYRILPVLCSTFPSNLGSPISGENNLKQCVTQVYNSSRQQKSLLSSAGRKKEESAMGFSGWERHLGLCEVLREINMQGTGGKQRAKQMGWLVCKN